MLTKLLNISFRLSRPIPAFQQQDAAPNLPPYKCVRGPKISPNSTDEQNKIKPGTTTFRKKFLLIIYRQSARCSQFVVRCPQNPNRTAHRCKTRPDKRLPTPKTKPCHHTCVSSPAVGNGGVCVCVVTRWANPISAGPTHHCQRQTDTNTHTHIVCVDVNKTFAKLAALRSGRFASVLASMI